MGNIRQSWSICGPIMVRLFAATCLSASFQNWNPFSEKENCIRVDNVDPKATKTELREYYNHFGTILGVSLETNDGSLILTDKEYQKLSYVCCYIRLSRRSEAKAAREMHEYIFRDRKLRVELAYQKHCDPNSKDPRDKVSYLLMKLFSLFPSRIEQQRFTNVFPKRRQCGCP